MRYNFIMKTDKPMNKNNQKELCPVCKNPVEDCVCCPECGHMCLLDQGELNCPVCGPKKQGPEEENG